tara:strand:+ start:338 stop:454 length:117 start_codon:yes stop_codon:yes gene_type:complete
MAKSIKYFFKIRSKKKRVKCGKTVKDIGKTDKQIRDYV